MEKAGADFSFFVVYGRTELSVDFAEIEVPELTSAERSPKEINALVKEKLGRRVVVVHAFIKKTRQTPERELKLARKRIKEILNG